MAGEIQVAYGQAGKTVYAQVRNRNGQIWSTTAVAFVAYVTANVANYALSLTEQGSASGFYVGDFPTAIPAGTYSVSAKQQVGGSVAENDPYIGTGNLEWNGVAIAPLSDTATSGQLGMFGPIRLARGVMIQNFGIYLKSSTDHVTPFVSGIVSGQIARDAGAFGPLASGAFTETGLGFYNLQAITSGDIVCNTAKLIFTANGVSGGVADPLPMTLVLQRVSGQL